MELWVAAVLAAVCFQTARFAIQKSLKSVGLSAVGATWARFVWTAPLLVIGLSGWVITQGLELPRLTAGFWAFAISGGVGQILATVCVVALFSRRNFAVGITFKKSEVLLTALVGWLLLGEAVSLAGFGALLLGAVALLILSREGGASVSGWQRFVSPSAGLGIASGAFFALAGVGYRGAMLALGETDLAFRAVLCLTIVTTLQSLLMLGWFLWRDRAEAFRVLAAWKPGIALGLTSMAGTFFWFVAFALQNAAYVYAVGQVELLLSILGGALLFGERLSRQETAGIGLLAASVVALVLVA